MGVTTLASPTVAPAFTRQARALRDRLRVASTECGRLIDEIAAPLVARSRRSPIPRVEQLVDVARMWRTKQPEFGRLDLTIEWNRRERSLCIRELRACPSDFRAVGWTTDEAGISVIGLALDVAPHRFSFVMPSLVSVSLHALGRRYQRGLDVSDEAVLGDMHVLAQSHMRLAAGEAGELVDIDMEDGRWCGHLADATNPNGGGIDRIFCARTYKEAKEAW